MIKGKIFFVAVAIGLLPNLLRAYPLTPNRDMTPGSLCAEWDRDFVEYRYSERIPYCERKVSGALKKKIYDAYEIPVEERRLYTIDHLIPLSLGGNNASGNLWPEHKKVKATRQDLEMKLFIAISEGKISRRDAVNQILTVKFTPVQPAPADEFHGEPESESEYGYSN